MLHFWFRGLIAYIPFVFLAGAALFFVIARLAWARPLIQDAISHWHQTIEGPSESIPELYQRIQNRIERWTHSDFKTTVIELAQASMLSERRLYLRVSSSCKRPDYIYDIFVMPYGGGLFVSTWLRRRRWPMVSLMLNVPIISWFTRLWLRVMRPQTYFRVDSALYFQETVHAALLYALDNLITVSHSRPIPEAERRPVNRELYAFQLPPFPPAGPKAPSHPALMA